ncbi:MAG: threonine/serine exporter family protein [Prevotella sp.]|uniref:threonine/serine exporter family protein n=1 Tax=Prevotella sp. TaxID=59823 RepID=UPI002A324554|nr:threonine/serine exporter family protein [Prevotella sp.]MDD7317173.1 threonine/serine exporter family protein [Prevotellaceae bacterium]MDY4019776.1 threonine/serine exporter family protein [Prevotella sp.]
MNSSLNKVGCFLSAYSALLLRSGATCTRLEQNVGRMAKAWNLSADITIMPRHVTLSVTSGGGDRTGIFTESTSNLAISFEKITRLSQMSWEVADNGWDIEKAESNFNDISMISPTNKWRVLLAVSCANGAFCRLFGGDMTAVAVVFVATFCGYYLKQLMLSKKIDTRIVFIVCAFVSSVLACADSLFSLGGTPRNATKGWLICRKCLWAN